MGKSHLLLSFLTFINLCISSYVTFSVKPIFLAELRHTVQKGRGGRGDMVLAHTGFDRAVHAAAAYSSKVRQWRLYIVLLVDLKAQQRLWRCSKKSWPIRFTLVPSPGGWDHLYALVVRLRIALNFSPVIQCAPLTRKNIWSSLRGHKLSSSYTAPALVSTMHLTTSLVPDM